MHFYLCIDDTDDKTKSVGTGEIATFIWNYKGKPAPGSKKPRFTDVPASHNYFKAIQWAAEQKITNGYSNGTFGPSKECTRGQMITFIYNMEKAG